MKIGTLTFHRACNFGGVLQSYALVTYLRKIGYDAEIIDYVSKSVESAYPLIYWNNLLTVLSSLKRLRVSILKRIHFKQFRKIMKVSSRTYYNASELKDIYDVIFIGSDQVWNKRINNGLDPVFWGNIPGSSRIVSYAASMGTSNNFSSEDYRHIKAFLKNFYALSVREDSVSVELSKLTDKSFITVVDPTLLLCRKDYESISYAKKGIKANTYVLYYQMEYNTSSKDRVEEIATELGCDVVVIGVKKERYTISSKHYDYGELKVEEFVWLFLNARCVLASSFHGVALSIAMRKDFYFLQVNSTDHAMNLLKYINAPERAIKPTEKIVYTDVNYDKIGKALDGFVQKSLNFIKDVIIN